MESKHRFPQALENACAFPTFPPPRLLLSFIKTKRKNSCPQTGEILDSDHVSEGDPKNRFPTLMNQVRLSLIGKVRFFNASAERVTSVFVGPIHALNSLKASTQCMPRL